MRRGITMDDDDELRINLLPPPSKKVEKSYFEVLRLCCNTEVPLIENLLNQLDGVEQVTVIVPTKTVVVVHDHLLITPLQIVRALNRESLEANIRVYGEEKKGRKWPSIYTMACGLLLLVSFFRYFYEPLNWLALAATIVGLPRIIFKCIAAVRNVRIDVNVLALVAVGGTVAMGDFLESAVIVFLFTISEWLESRASHKATAVMSSLLNMAPQKAILAENGLVVDARDVELNTILAVKAGEVIPIDGVVVEGSCEVDEKSLTGEPFPVAKQEQSKVLAGTININGYIAVKTTALAEDCAVAKMANLVEQAQNSKSQTQRLIDNIAKYYTPAVVFLSIGIVAIPAALRIHDIKPWAHLALVILVSACPCGLILSTPIAIFCALTKAASTGLLIKGGDYLESLANVKITAFDKTGTITRGEFSIEDFRSIRNDISLNTLLYWVSSIESKSSHPMAEALIDFGRSNSIEPKPESVSEFHHFPGEGICGEIDGKLIYVGNKRIALRAGCQGVPHVEGATVGYIFLGAEHIGTFSLVDSCRTGAAEAINQLKSLGIKTAILTGDSYTAAMRVQNQLEHAIDIVHADLLPEEKVNIIKELKKEGPTVMIGDGINDAPALATADIGISMGISGSALATESGHITLMSNDLKKIPEAIRLAIETRRKIIENVCLSIVTKAAIIALAISGHPLLWAAVLVDVGTCLLVIFNSMLILRGVTTSTPGEKCETRAIRSSGFVGGSSSAYHVTLNCSDELAAGDGLPGACSSRVKQRCCSVGDKPRTDDAKKEKKCDAKQSCCSVGGKPRTDDAKKEKECAVKRSCCVDDKTRTDDAKKEKECGAKQSCCSVGDKPKTDDANKEKECGAKQKCCSVGDKPKTDGAKNEKECGAKKKCCSVGDKPRTNDAKDEKEFAAKQRCSVGDKPRTDDAKKEKECAAKQRCCSVSDKPRTDDAKSEKECAAKQSCCSVGDRPRTDNVQKEKECASYVIQIMSNDTNEVENSRCQSNVATKTKCCDSNVATKTRCCDSSVTTKTRCCDSSVATKTRCCVLSVS